VFTFPLLAHLALAAPAGRLARRTARPVIAAVYAWAVFTALVLALVRDPFYDPSCWSDCDGNAFLVHSWPPVSDALVDARPWVQLALGVAVAALALRRLARPGPLARAWGLAAAAVGAVAVLHALRLLSTSFEDPMDTAFRRIFFAACGAAVLVALALTAPRAQILLRRRAVRNVVTALDEAPAPHELERELGAALDDPTLRIVVRLAALGRCVDSSGADCDAPIDAEGRAVTPLARRGEIVAWIEHDPAVTEAVEPALTAAVRLSVDNARLRAELLAQVRDLREARRRIVADGDDERRRLERDLHDGVQQQLLALGADLRAGASVARAAGDAAAGAFEDAVARTAAVLEEVRSVAHGIYPAILTDAGVGAAVASLADVAALPVETVRLPEGRYAAPVEAAAYRVVAEGIENAVSYSGASVVAVEVSEAAGTLVVRVHDDGRGGAVVREAGGLAELVDRVGAIDGTMSIASAAGTGTTISAVIPCGS
jgi:signal transduction histidine kinase